MADDQLDTRAISGAVPSPQDPQRQPWFTVCQKCGASHYAGETCPSASPQDPPADALLDTIADHWPIGDWRPYEDRFQMAQNALDALAAAGLAVVHADVPHGSRAEESETFRPTIELLAALLTEIVALVSAAGVIPDEVQR